MLKTSLEEFQLRNPDAVARDYVGPHLVSTLMLLSPKQTDDGMGRYLTYTSIDGVESETWGLDAALKCHAQEVERTRGIAVPHGHDD